MTREQLDTEVFDDSIDPGSSETFEVDTARAENIIILIDNGTTGVEPAEYTLTQRVRVQEHSDYQFYDQVTASTSRSYTDPAWGSHMEVEIENTTASSANYRITIKSYRKLD